MRRGLKFPEYALWLHWEHTNGCGGCWQVHAVVKVLPHPADNPRDFLREYVENCFPSKWGSDWRRSVSIRPAHLPGPRRCPAGYGEGK